MNDNFYTGNPSFDAAVQAFLTHCQKVANAYHDANGWGESVGRVYFKTTNGPKYVKVIRGDVNGNSRSAYCFINRENGDILLPRSWAGPAKGARGNVYQEMTYGCAGPYDVSYLR